MPPSEAARVITRWRERLRWSKRRLAREVRCSPAYIVQLENGERAVTPKVLGAIADAMGQQPYRLLGEAGFIPGPDLEEALEMAREAYGDPEFRNRAGTVRDKPFDWLVADYLYLLGHDPYGTGWEYGPGGNSLDWSHYAPERSAAAKAFRAAHPDSASREAAAHELRDAAKAPSQIEGWEDLTPTQQRLVQQLVNELRREGATDADET